MSRLMAMSPELMTAMTPEAVQLCFARIVATVMIATSAATKPTVGSLTGLLCRSARDQSVLVPLEVGDVDLTPRQVRFHYTACCPRRCAQAAVYKRLPA